MDNEEAIVEMFRIAMVLEVKGFTYEEISDAAATVADEYDTSDY